MKMFRVQLGQILAPMQVVLLGQHKPGLQPLFVETLSGPERQLGKREWARVETQESSGAMDYPPEVGCCGIW